MARVSGRHFADEGGGRGRLARLLGGRGDGARGRRGEREGGAHEPPPARMPQVTAVPRRYAQKIAPANPLDHELRARVPRLRRPQGAGRLMPLDGSAPQGDGATDAAVTGDAATPAPASDETTVLSAVPSQIVPDPAAPAAGDAGTAAPVAPPASGADDTMMFVRLAEQLPPQEGGASERGGAARTPAPDETGAQESAARPEPAPQPAGQEGVGERVGRSAALISLCVIISRVTGFIRTWAMGFAMGTTLLSSSYQVACNLPNQLYELVMGGMLVTAFLPVYVSLRKREGQERASRYASTLLGLVVIVLGAVALACTVFAPQVVYTQMFLNPAGDRELVTHFFRFFAIQLLFYGVSAVVGGLLNAERDYVWSSAAPIANNLVVIVAMFAYVFVAPSNPDLAVQVISVGTPLGVFTQMMIQIPPLARKGIHLRPRIDIHDPALRETLALGIPTIVVTVCSFVTVSVQNASAMAVSEAGSSVLFYARQWFTLPYAILAVPLTTTLFTELSDMAADGDRRGMRDAILGGTRQNLFFMIPFMLYLIVFSPALVTLFCAGSFTQQSVGMVAGYLAWMAVSLPFYALFLFMQKVFSSLRRMRFYAAVNVVVSAVQVVLTLALPLGFAGWGGVGINGIALAQTAFFALGDVGCYAYLHREFAGIGGIRMGAILASALRSLALGLAGAAAGAAAMAGLALAFGPFAGSIARALAYVIPSGLLALAVTYGLAVALRVPEASFVRHALGRLLRRRG